MFIKSLIVFFRDSLADFLGGLGGFLGQFLALFGLG